MAVRMILFWFLTCGIIRWGMSKRLLKESDDPGWMPEKMVRKSGNLTGKAEKSKAGSPISDDYSSPSETTSYCGVAPFSSGHPPQYLVRLLNLFGWKVDIQPGSHDHVYISPAGVAYYSLPRAFETFLHDTSKYKGSPWIVSKLPQSKVVTVNSNQENPIGRRNNVDVAMIRTSAVAEIAGPSLPLGKSHKTKQDNTNWEQLSQKAGEVSELGMNQAVAPLNMVKKAKTRQMVSSRSLITDNGQTSSGTKHDRSFSEVRRSLRISGRQSAVQNAVDTVFRRSTRIDGKHNPIYDELALEMVTDDDTLYLPEHARSRMTMKDKQKLAISGAFDNMGGRHTPLSDEMQSKKVNTKQSECQKLNAHKQLASENARKSQKNKNPRSELSSLGLNAVEMEKSVAEKCSTPLTTKRKQAGRRFLNKEKKKKRKCGCSLIVHQKEKIDHQVHHKDISLETKYTILSWLIDAGTLAENEKVMYVSKSSTSSISSGFVQRKGIMCDCCKNIVALLDFESHAGSDLHQPWDNIFLLSGKTLLQCLGEAWDQEKRQNKVGFQGVDTDGPDPSDDICGVCADGGHLICCDTCPSTFHQDCLMLKTLPDGCWDCPYCRCAVCMAAACVPNGVPKTLTLLTCKQCRCKYHRKCASENKVHVVDFFCGENCKQLADQLMHMLGTVNYMEDGFSWTLLRLLEEDEGVRSKSFVLECNVKLAMALSMLNECFLPLVDQRTGLDIICQAVYSCGSNFPRMNYEGFYTMILEKDGEIISAATLRFHGRKFAEMPFVGTRPIYQRQGMCLRLMKAVEQMMSSLRVEKLIIPSIPDLVKTWMTSFFFKPLGSALKDEIRNLSLVVFAETTLLEKSICSTLAVQEDKLHSDNIVSHDKSRQGIQDLPVSCDVEWWNHEYSMTQEKNTTPEACKMTQDYCFASGLSSILTSSSLNSSLLGGLPICNTSLTNHETIQQNITPFPLSNPPVVVGQDNQMGPGCMSPLSSQMNMCLQNANDATQTHRDAVYSTILFDNLLRIGR
ncbi:uncharacterized protein [Typha angustifolia]|uniref:uncharacterized protein isoform X2 n=1 Tax=Typha angustifolia TaxID=59011 RepID=UPI003C2E7F8B